MRNHIGRLIVYAATMLFAVCMTEARAAEPSDSTVIVDGRPGKQVDNAFVWETSVPVQQALAAARSYWSAQDPKFEEKLRSRGFAAGAFTRSGAKQHAVLFMMSDIPRCCTPMGLVIVEGEQLIRNIAFDTVTQSIRAIPDVNGDGRNELALGGSFTGQGLVTEAVTLAAFGDDGLEDFGQAVIFESACGAGYGDTGALAARLSINADDEIVIEQFQQTSCDSDTWELNGEPQPLPVISDRQKTAYTDIPLEASATE